jgi:hypothetical protein
MGNGSDKNNCASVVARQLAIKQQQSSDVLCAEAT